MATWGRILTGVLLLAGIQLTSPHARSEPQPSRSALASPSGVDNAGSQATGAKAASDSESGAATLQLSMRAHGPYTNWSVELTNTGKEPTHLLLDPRLLWLEVKVPGRRKLKVCRLPRSLLPAQGKSEAQENGLKPGETYSFEVDPRFYCFARNGQEELVPGAYVVPHYGFPEAKRAPTAEPSASGLGSVSGAGFALDSSYHKWANTRVEPANVSGQALRLSLSAGSDSPNANEAFVRLTLKNRSDGTVPVYFFREGITLIAHGAHGTLRCEPAEVLRAPAPESYTWLRPGATTSLDVRLAERCGREFFDAPGYYVLTAHFTTRTLTGVPPTGAFQGDLQASGTRLIRVQRGVGRYSPRAPVALRSGHPHGPPGPPADEGS